MYFRKEKKIVLLLEQSGLTVDISVILERKTIEVQRNKLSLLALSRKTPFVPMKAK